MHCLWLALSLHKISCARQIKNQFSLLSLNRIFALMIHRIAVIVILISISVGCKAQDERYHGDGIDDVLRWIPLATVYTLKLSGVESSSQSWKRLVVNTAAAYVINTGVTWGLKQTIHKRRPDGTDNKAFPSGHTAFAFCGATILHKEYGKKSPLISIAGYSVATVVAVDRIRRNRHKWQDVLAGSAIGILSAECGYLLGDLITGGNDKTDVAIMPNGIQVIVKL